MSRMNKQPATNEISPSIIYDKLSGEHQFLKRLVMVFYLTVISGVQGIETVSITNLATAACTATMNTAYCSSVNLNCNPLDTIDSIKFWDGVVY